MQTEKQTRKSFMQFLCKVFVDQIKFLCLMLNMAQVLSFIFLLQKFFHVYKLLVCIFLYFVLRLFTFLQ